MSNICKTTAAVNPLDARFLGSIETGFYRNRGAGLFSRSVNSIARKLLKSDNPRPSKACIPVALSTSLISQALPLNSRVADVGIKEPDQALEIQEFDDAFLDKTLCQLLLGESDSQASPVDLESAIRFDPYDYICKVDQRAGRFNPTAYSHWKFMMKALALPGGKRWLLGHGAKLPQDAERLNYLVNLAKSCLQIEKENHWFPDVVLDETPEFVESETQQTTAELAGKALLAGIRGDRCNYEKLSWSVNALRNHLDLSKNPEEFTLINKRLLKVGVWARRCAEPGLLSRIFPLLKKSPFRALRFGLMGADQTDNNQPRMVVKNGQFSQILSVLNHLIDHMEGASRLKLFNGGRIGITTKGLGVVLTNLVSFLVFHVKFGLLALRLRTAGIEIAMPPYNMELMIYSSKGISLQAGIGAAVGPDLALFQANAGGEINPLIYEQQHSEGIVLRMPRVRGHEAQLRVRFKSMLSDLLEWSINPEFDEKTNSGELLKKLLGKYQELSVSTIDQHTHKKRGLSAGVDASIGLDAHKVRFSATVDTKLEFTSLIKRVYKDSKGAINVMKHTMGKQFKVSSGLELGIRYSQSSTDLRYNTPSTLVWGSSLDWLSGSREARREVVYNENSLHSMSFLEVQFQSLKDFRKSVLNNLDSWVDTRAMQKKIDKNLARDQIINFMNKLERKKDTAKIYAIRAEVKSQVAKKIDQMNAIIHLLEMSQVRSSAILATLLRVNVENLLESAHSYTPTSFRVFERHDKSSYRGLHFLFNNHSATGAEGVHAQDRLM